MQELVKYARVLLVLQLKQMDLAAQAGKGPAIRPELLLSDAGFGNKEIAEMLGKNYAAVAKAISRARSARGNETTEDDIGVGNGE